MPYKDPEKRRTYHRAYLREWQKRNPDRVRKYAREYARAHREERAKYHAIYYVANRKRLIAYVVNTRDREAHRATQAKRRAAPGSYTIQEWKDKVMLFAGCCAYCGEDRPLGPDHKIPLSRGGTHDISNIVPACFPCNSKKRAQTAYEFLGLIPKVASSIDIQASSRQSLNK
jgi:5-methylcytosine-specific restriction endonuclease McrA